MIMNRSRSCSFTYSTSWRTFGSSIVVSWTLLVKLQHTRSSEIDGNYLLKYCEVMFSFSSSWFAGRKLKTSDRLDFSLIPRKSKVVRLLRCTPKSMKSFRLSWSRQMLRTPEKSKQLSKLICLPANVSVLGDLILSKGYPSSIFSWFRINANLGFTRTSSLTWLSLILSLLQI